MHLTKDAGAGVSLVDRPATAPVTRGQGVHAEFVEAGDEGGDGVATLAADGVGGVLVVGPAGDGQQEPRAGDLSRRSGRGATEAGEGIAFEIRQGAEGILLVAGHGSAPRLHDVGLRLAYSPASNMATNEASDPLAESVPLN